MSHEMVNPSDFNKIQLRKQMRSLRDGMDSEIRSSHSSQIALKLLAREDVLNAERIFIYVSFRSEVATHRLIERLIQGGKNVFIPVIRSNDQMQMARFTGWENMRADSFGVLVPDDPIIDQGHIDTAIVPGLGFSPSGSRIGYGKGHYDRFFSHHTVGTKVGIAFDCQIIEQIPTNALDYPMDRVVSESRELIAEN